MNMRPMAGLVRPPKNPITIKPPVMSGNVKPPKDFPGFKPPFKPMGGLVQPPTQKQTIKETIGKIGKLLSNKKNLLIHTETWMNLQDIMLHERSRLHTV